MITCANLSPESMNPAIADTHTAPFGLQKITKVVTGAIAYSVYSIALSMISVFVCFTSFLAIVYSLCIWYLEDGRHEAVVELVVAVRATVAVDDPTVGGGILRR